MMNIYHKEYNSLSESLQLKSSQSNKSQLPVLKAVITSRKSNLCSDGSRNRSVKWGPVVTNVLEMPLRQSNLY